MKKDSVQPDELYIRDNEKLLLISMERKDYIGSHYGPNNEIVDDFDDNKIEIFYKQADEGGWGSGGGVYFSTYDIKNMADGIRAVTGKTESDFSYSCLDDMFRMELHYNPDTDSYIFTASMMETLLGEYYITVTKDSLTEAGLEKYVQPFFEWEKQYPIVKNSTVKGKQTDILQERLFDCK